MERNRLALGWALTNYEESVDTISDQGRRVDQARYLKDGCVPVIDQGEAFIGGYTDDESKRYDGPLPIIVFGDHTRRVKYVDFPFVVGAQGVKLLMPRECWFPKFFSYLLPSLDIRDRGYSRHFQFIRKLEFPLPPLAEQRRIVAEIEKQCTRLDAAVEALKRVRANVKRYRASVLKAACEGRLVPTEDELARAEGRNYEPADALLQRMLKERRAKWEANELAKTNTNGKVLKDDEWRAKYKQPAAPSLTGVPNLPIGWVWASVAQLGPVQSGQTPRGVEDAVEKEGQIPWFKVGDMNVPGNELHMRIAKQRLSPRAAERLGFHVMPAGTFVFPKRGGAIATNKKRILAQPSCCDLNVMGVKPEDSVALYFWWWFSSIDLGQLADGSNVPQINHGDIEPLGLPLPPLAEQQRIVAEVERRLSVIEELEASVEANLKRAERLRQSILRRAFEGKLVPQDPNDEPASILLDRIRAERNPKKTDARSSERGSSDAGT